MPSSVRQAEAFADASEGITSTRESRVASFDDGVAVQRVMDAARGSSRGAGWVDVN